jgi:cadmium resistance protein CadD (predicted permease)
MEVLAQLLVGVAAFVATSIDDLFLVAVLFADRQLRPASIVAGQLAGIGGLVAVSALAALGAVAIPGRWAALLGVLPLAIGVHQLSARLRDDGSARADEWKGEVRIALRSRSQLFAVAAVTLANGGDNLAVYTPLFARSPAAIPLHAATFVLMTCAWCWIGSRLVASRWLAGPLRRHGHVLLPLVLVGLGIYILSDLFGSAS